jgi:hypothetical protein
MPTSSDETGLMPPTSVLGPPSRLLPRSVLIAGVPGMDTMESPNGDFKAVLQIDGNFVVYDKAGKDHYSAGPNSEVRNLVMHPDGKLVMRNGTGGGVREANSHGGSGSELVLLNNGDLVIMDGSVERWRNGVFVP